MSQKILADLETGKVKERQSLLEYVKGSCPDDTLTIIHRFISDF